MADLVESVSEIIDNIQTLESYRSGNAEQQKFWKRTIENGRVFVAIKREGKYLFSPSKFSGYRENNTTHIHKRDSRDGRRTNRRISTLLSQYYDVGSPQYEVIEREFIAYCKKYGLTPSRHERNRRYWLISPLSRGKPSVAGRKYSAPNRPIPKDAEFLEGQVHKRLLTRRERNPEARRACIEHYGLSCLICSFNFGEIFGESGVGFIHVHHVEPVSTKNQRYKVDPVADLRPVCPNCHAMLHRKPTTATMQEVRNLLLSGNASTRARLPTR